jgi:hypothetical protein
MRGMPRLSALGDPGVGGTAGPWFYEPGAELTT